MQSSRPTAYPIHLPEKYTFQKLLDRNYFNPNVYFLERALARNCTSLNVHLPDIAFAKIHSTCQKLHQPNGAFGRNYTSQNLHFLENLFSKICTFQNFHLAEITFPQNQFPEIVIHITLKFQY